MMITYPHATTGFKHEQTKSGSKLVKVYLAILLHKNGQKHEKVMIAIVQVANNTNICYRMICVSNNGWPKQNIYDMDVLMMSKNLKW